MCDQPREHSQDLSSSSSAVLQGYDQPRHNEGLSRSSSAISQDLDLPRAYSGDLSRTSSSVLVGCPICLGALSHALHTPCGHTFCRPCIMKTMEAYTIPPTRGLCPMCRGAISVYTIRDDAGAPLATPDITTIFGSVFVQIDTWGLASYHFDAETDCYISYAAAPRYWALDDGSKFPAKKPFKQTSFDAAARTFRGLVTWDPPATAAGNTTWEYELVFAEDFSAIVGGQVRCSDAEDDDPETILFRPPWCRVEPDTLCYSRWVPPPDPEPEGAREQVPQYGSPPLIGALQLS